MNRRAHMARLMRSPDAYEPVPECTPTYTLDRQIAEARAEMGEDEWARRNAEWDQGS